MMDNEEVVTEHRIDTVLIVDDEQALRSVLGKMLIDEGCRVLTAADGVEAQSILTANPEPISVVILDWLMPEMSGIDLLRWMKVQPRIEHIPVIMLTALDDPERIKEGIDAGAFYYLIKPFQKPLLQSILRAAVSDYHSTRQLLEKLKQCARPLAFMDEGTFRFRTLAEADQLAVMIASATPEPEHAMVIAELLLNAVEHGNLGITYEDKGRLVAENTWNEEIDRRLALPANQKKYAIARMRREGSTLRVEIEDQGPGFDFESYMQINEVRMFDNHGRGIAIARSALNMEFVQPGNRVIVTIPMDVS
jgi:DNA-binding response OmpR family regulator